MPPKRSDLHHITFHFYRSAVLLSVPGSTTFSSLKSQLLPALQPLEAALPVGLPATTSDFRIYEEKPAVEGQESQPGLSCVDDDKGASGRTVGQLGWTRWQKVFVSFRDGNGLFSDPVFTVPDVEDEDPDGEQAE